MSEAIKLAIEKGGYIIPKLQANPNATSEGIEIILNSLNKNDIVLDPLFWQALGKALGWINYAKPQWLQHALKYHELVLINSNTEKFWKELLQQELLLLHRMGQEYMGEKL